MGGGRLREVVAHGGSTAFECHISGAITPNYFKFCNPYITSYARLTSMQWPFKNTSNSCRVPVYKVHFIMTTVINLHPENKSERRSIICLLHIEPIKFACNINTLH